jgi:mRNA interferase RelE/StbE
LKSLYRFRAPAEVARLLRGLHPQIKHKIRSGLNVLGRDALAGKALKDEFEGLRSLRVGRFRIVYRTATRRVIEIVAIGPRKTVYEETLRLVTKDRTR